MRWTVWRLRPGLAFLAAVLITGCTMSGDAYVKEVQLQQLDKDARLYVERIRDSDGLFLYSPAGERQYLIVNYASVANGEKAPYLEKLTAEVREETLKIELEERSVSDVADKRLGDMRIYRLIGSQDYSAIRIYKNGTETSLNSAGT
ncbi:hypothetical protein [Paenibacillus tengchongensis]|uniref:hypothetical protein n=1 Tax=Paenibacillus tengchongensis TaxID=2608684 RepID=UPI00124D187A|nr:hypothetical protein [Paenibacillus tengchongensis]